MSKAGVMDAIDACRSPIRRKIMLLAEETAQRGDYLTVSAAHAALGYKNNERLPSLSYHFKRMWEAGVLHKSGGEHIRGAYQTHYVPSGEFQATTLDSVALDRIAELIDNAKGPGLSQKLRAELVRVVRTSGRPVEA